MKHFQKEDGRKAFKNVYKENLDKTVSLHNKKGVVLKDVIHTGEERGRFYSCVAGFTAKFNDLFGHSQ